MDCGQLIAGELAAGVNMVAGEGGIEVVDRKLLMAGVTVE